MDNFYFSCFTSFSKNPNLKNRSFSIFQLNVAGINNIKKFSRIKKLILVDMKFKPDIIVLGETKLKHASSLYHLNGYDMHSCCRISEHCGGGLFVYTRKEHKISSSDVAKSTTSFEKITFNILCSGRQTKFLCYYRPPVNGSLKPFVGS